MGPRRRQHKRRALREFHHTGGKLRGKIHFGSENGLEFERYLADATAEPVSAPSSTHKVKN
jgi:hypothetical protein